MHRIEDSSPKTPCPAEQQNKDGEANRDADNAAFPLRDNSISPHVLPEAWKDILTKANAQFVERRSSSNFIDQHRAHPPISAVDTIIVRHGHVQSLHDPNGSAKFISTESVKHIHLSKRDWDVHPRSEVQRLELGGSACGVFVLPTRYEYLPVAVRLDEKGRVSHLVPQRAHRSCVYASASMILLDCCSRIGIPSLSSNRIFELVTMGNLGNSEGAARLLNEALTGTVAKAGIVELNSLKPEELCRQLDLYGPAEGSIGGEIGGHSIVLSSMRFPSDSHQPIVTIRDPFHAWDIDVEFKSLIKRGLSNTLVQCWPVDLS